MQLTKLFRYSTLLLAYLFFISSLYAQARSFEVIEGQELMLFNKTSNSSGFKTSANQRALHFGGAKSIKFVTNRIAVAGLSNSGSSIKLVGEDSLKSACNKIANSEIGCEINHVLKLSATPNDSSWSSLSGLRKISSEAAWNSSTGSRSIKVAVIDTGVDYNHPDLIENIALNTAEVPNNGIDDDNNGYIDDYYGFNFNEGNSNSDDDNGHGTHVAGTIGAVGNNALGVVGVNWQVGIIPVKVLSAQGSGTLSSVIAGVNYAVARGAHVLNLSLGGGGFSQSFYSAIQNANNAGALLIAAAGNESNNNDTLPSYPANYNLPNVISVAATSSNDSLASFSNYGASVHIAAPGVNILSTLPGGTYGAYSGTSMATPHVAGAAALLKAFSPGSSMLQIKSALLNNGDIIGSLSGKVATSARMNVAAAMSALGGGSSEPTPGPAPEPTPPAGDSPSNPGDGVDSPDDGDDFEQVIDYVGVETKLSKKKGALTVTIFAIDSDDDAIEDVEVTLSCDGKLLGTKSTNSNGDAKFSVKLRKNKTECEAIAQNDLGLVTKSFILKKSVRKR